MFALVCKTAGGVEGKGWICGERKKNRGVEQGLKKQSETAGGREGGSEREGQHVKAGSVLTASHVREPGVCVCETRAADVTG